GLHRPGATMVHGRAASSSRVSLLLLVEGAPESRYRLRARSPVLLVRTDPARRLYAVDPGRDRRHSRLGAYSTGGFARCHRSPVSTDLAGHRLHSVQLSRGKASHLYPPDVRTARAARRTHPG